MRIVCAGSPTATIASLEAVQASHHELVGVISQPARPVGRKRIVTETPVSRWAAERGIAVETPETSSGLHRVLTDWSPDLAVAIAYGRLIRAEELTIPRYGWWNVHFSLLPKYRGAAPVQHALLKGERTTGVTVFELDSGLDTGPIINQASHSIEPFHSAGQLLEELAHLGAWLLAQSLDQLAQGLVTPEAQTGEASLAPKLERRDGELDWNLPVAEVFRRWQATTPEPGAFTQLRGREGSLRILLARPAPQVLAEPGEIRQENRRVVVGCQRGSLELLRVQPSGKNPMSAADWVRGIGPGVSCGR